MTDSDLSVAWSPDGTWVVHSPQEDGPDKAYKVDLVASEDAPSCSCKHGQTRSDATASDACKHIGKVVRQTPTLPTEEMVEAARAMAAREARRVREESEEVPEGSSGGGRSDSADSGSQAGSDDGEVETVEDTNSAQDEALDRLQEWFEGAAEFNGYDPSIVDLSWAEADGTEGVAVETEPFTGGYYDDGEWADKDGFDAAKDALMDSVLSAKDPYRWYGEPDYCHFATKDAVLDLVGGDDDD